MDGRRFVLNNRFAFGLVNYGTHKNHPLKTSSRAGDAQTGHCYLPGSALKRSG
jgi:hypothetical protein